MLFNSLGYLLLLGLAVLLHWMLPHRFRIWLLAAVSLLMYCMWRWDFAVLLLCSASAGFLCAGQSDAAPSRRKRRAWLLTGLAAGLGPLIFFKYTYFLVGNANWVLSQLGAGAIRTQDWGFRIILPLGISFYTFQILSYVIDVYRRTIPPASHFISFLTYVIYWPQLIAGPILRADEVIPQMEKERFFDLDQFTGGCWLILSGLFKKIVIADGVAGMVEYWFSQPAGGLTAIDVWVATILFGFQIYCDFSGYSDIAIGSARLMGIEFPKNFDWPYMATSPREFWKRWHISLSSWIRDYLYLPLAGRKFRTRSVGGIGVAAEEQESVSQRRLAVALILTWLIMGLWHGAAWKFVLWGLYHGLIILAYRSIKPLQKLPQKVPVLAWAITLPLAMIGWIPFRAASVQQSAVMFLKLLNPAQYRLSEGVVGMSVRIAGESYLWALLLLVFSVGVYLVQRRLERRPLPVAAEAIGGGVVAACMVVLILMSMSAKEVFIYFQF